MAKPASQTRFKGVSSEQGDRRSQVARADSDNSETTKAGRLLSRFRTMVKETGEATSHDFLPSQCCWSSGENILQGSATKGFRTLEHRSHLASGPGITVTVRQRDATLKAAGMGLTVRNTHSESLVPRYVGGATGTVRSDAIDRYPRHDYDTGP